MSATQWAVGLSVIVVPVVVVVVDEVIKARRWRKGFEAARKTRGQ